MFAETVKRRIRPHALPLLHRWQRFHSISKVRWHEFTARFTWNRIWQRRRAMKDSIPVVEDTFGIRFLLYPFDQPRLLDLIERTDDRVEFRAIADLVRTGDTAFDIGANKGTYSVFLSRLCGPTGHVWSFEPVPDTYWRLRETLVLNRCENVSTVQAAVCQRDGTICMNLFGQHLSEWSSIGKPSMTQAGGKRVFPHKSVQVDCVTLDAFCDAQKIEHINFLKVDVEGFEISVFQGAQRLLSEHRIDYICFEISKEPLEGAGVASRNVFDALAVHGYLAYHVDEDTGKFIGPIEDTTEPWANFFASWKGIHNV